MADKYPYPQMPRPDLKPEGQAANGRGTIPGTGKKPQPQPTGPMKHPFNN